MTDETQPEPANSPNPDPNRFRKPKDLHTEMLIAEDRESYGEGAWREMNDD